MTGSAKSGIDSLPGFRCASPGLQTYCRSSPRKRGPIIRFVSYRAARSHNRLDTAHGSPLEPVIGPRIARTRWGGRRSKVSAPASDLVPLCCFLADLPARGCDLGGLARRRRNLRRFRRPQTADRVRDLAAGELPALPVEVEDDAV